jgi:hypothetical protein
MKKNPLLILAICSASATPLWAANDFPASGDVVIEQGSATPPPRFASICSA